MSGAVRLLFAAAACGAIGAVVVRASAPAHDAAGERPAELRRVERRDASSSLASAALRSAPETPPARLGRV
ncbi:MAG: hypothetical protein AAGB93_25435, partial [Planctomycetota bacterium]